ncbi:Amino-acid permease BAT1 [Tetrabaena socialis]|uniref:Amino-acid permease BAT1 n=1 Tax=Tetrabaena socialis TaxID=47790 RepID=A0A2J8A219_9CHLO|nr:Amino-acid permease BAT1 [Tetrabaena socialis]|eukprot:PNH06563.1 Amino-acid permease BAT1 [Tetrabaena socialis]
MMYALARDDGVPLAAFAKRLQPRTRAPVYAVLYMLFLTGLLSAPMCFNEFIFPAITSFAVVACYVAYALPVACKLWTRRRFFLPGPFYLGPTLSFANNCVTLVWVGTVTVLFTLPQFYPVTARNMNWSGPLLGLAVALALAWYYFPRYGSRNWYIGPITNLGQFKDVLPSDTARAAAALEAEEEAAAAAAEAAARADADADKLQHRITQGDRSAGGAAATGVASISFSAGRDGGGGGKAEALYARLSSGKCAAHASPVVTVSGYVLAAAAAVSVTAAAGGASARASGSGSGLRFVDASGGGSAGGRPRLRAAPGSPLRHRRDAAAAGGGRGGRARRHSMVSLQHDPAAAAAQDAGLLRRGDSSVGPGPGPGGDGGEVRRSLGGGECRGPRAEAAARRMSAVSVAGRPLLRREQQPRIVGEGSAPYGPGSAFPRGRGAAPAAAAAAALRHAGGSHAGGSGRQPQQLLALGCGPRQPPAQARHQLLRAAAPEGRVPHTAAAAAAARERGGGVSGTGFVPTSQRAMGISMRRASISNAAVARGTDMARRRADDAAADADADLTTDSDRLSGAGAGEDRASVRARMRAASVSVITVMQDGGGHQTARHAAAQGAADVRAGAAAAAVVAAPPLLLNPRSAPLALASVTAAGGASAGSSGDDEGSGSSSGGGSGGGSGGCRSSLDAMLRQALAARVSVVSLVSRPGAGPAEGPGGGGGGRPAAAGAGQSQGPALRPAGMGGG